jgi:hypothetical protein
MSASHPRQIWPMKWIVIAIVAMIVPYTFLTLRYRKLDKAFQPYEDIKSRANVSRLLAAGFQRIAITAQRPADGARANGGAVIATAPGGIPAELRSTLVEAPLLPTEIIDVVAAPIATTLQPYVIQLTCSLPSEKQHLGGAELFIREQTLIITPTFEATPGDLQSRGRDTAVLLTIPAGALKPGVYSMTVVGERSSRSWSFEVK